MKCYRRLKQIKAMSFDLDDTLYDNVPVVRNAEAWLQHHLRTEYADLPHLDAMDWLRIKRQVLARDAHLKHDMSALRIAVLTQFFVDNTYTEQLAQETAHTIFKLFLAVRSDFVVPEKSLQVLKLIAEKMPVIAITNGNVDTDALGLTPYFSGVIKAGNGLKMKPSSDMFRLASQQLGIEPQHILHVGDHPISDVAGAIRNDYMAAWLNLGSSTAFTDTKMIQLPDIEITDLDELLSLL